MLYALCYLPKADSYCVISLNDAILRNVDFFVNRIGMEHKIKFRSKDKQELENLLASMKSKEN